MRTFKEYLSVCSKPEDYHPEFLIKTEKEVEENPNKLLCFGWTPIQACREVCSFCEKCDSYNATLAQNDMYKSVFYTVIVIDEW
jgi:hypothetical protein